MTTDPIPTDPTTWPDPVPKGGDWLQWTGATWIKLGPSYRPPVATSAPAPAKPIVRTPPAD